MELIRIVNLYFEKEYSPFFIERFKQYKPRLLEQEGCLDVSLLKDCCENGDFVTISKWTDKKYLEDYRKSGLFRNMWASIKPKFRKQAKAISTIEINN